MRFRGTTVEFKQLSKYFDIFKPEKVVINFNDENCHLILSNQKNYLKFSVKGKGENCDNISILIKQVDELNKIIKDITKKRGFVDFEIKNEIQDILFIQKKEMGKNLSLDLGHNNEKDCIVQHELNFEIFNTLRIKTFLQPLNVQNNCDAKTLSVFTQYISKKTSTTIIGKGMKRQPTLKLLSKTFISLEGNKEEINYLTLAPNSMCLFTHCVPQKQRLYGSESKYYSVEDEAMLVLKKTLAIEKEKNIAVAILVPNFIGFEMSKCTVYLKVDKHEMFNFPTYVNKKTYSKKIDVLTDINEFTLADEKLLKDEQKTSTSHSTQGVALIYDFKTRDICCNYINEILLNENQVSFNHNIIKQNCFAFESDSNISIDENMFEITKTDAETKSECKMSLIKLEKEET